MLNELINTIVNCKMVTYLTEVSKCKADNAMQVVFKIVQMYTVSQFVRRTSFAHVL